MKVEKIMIIGAGQMGLGIAQVCATSGYQVVLNDLNQEVLTVAKKIIAKNLLHLVAKGKLSEGEKEKILSRIETTQSLDNARHVGMVIEVATEQMSIKKDIFAQLDKIVSKNTILATNTSSLSITEIATSTNNPENVIGMHFMNPVPRMKLVEIIRGLDTNDDTFKIVYDFVQSLAKTSLEVKDFPGFVLNRILLVMINEAIYTLYENIADKESIDEMMKLGANHPLGPLELADLIGLDTCLHILETLHFGFGDDKYRPCPLLRQYVAAKRLGRKTGSGFYTYQN